MALCSYPLYSLRTKSLTLNYYLQRLQEFYSLADDLSEHYGDEEFYKYIAGAAVNEIFGDHSDESRRMFENNKSLVRNTLKNLDLKHPDLKQLITDTLRVYVIANLALGSKKMSDHRFWGGIFEQAEKLGLFIKGGKEPQ